MLVLTRTVGQSLLIEDVRLDLIHADSRSIIFAMQKLSGGRETKVQLYRHQIVDVCYNVKFQLISIDKKTARLGLEAPEEVHIERMDDGFSSS